MVNRLQQSLVLLSAAVLTACGGQAENSQPSTSAPSAQTQTEPAAQTQPVAASPAAQAAPAAPKTPSPEFANLPEPYVNADFARAKRIWRQCSSCHNLAADADHLVGPNLYGMFERKVGVAEGFNYSNALQEADFDWTPEQLNEWLTNPQKFLPGNRMSFRGVRKPDDRTNVIAYIMAASETAKTE